MNEHTHPANVLRCPRCGSVVRAVDIAEHVLPPQLTTPGGALRVVAIPRGKGWAVQVQEADGTWGHVWREHYKRDAEAFAARTRKDYPNGLGAEYETPCTGGQP